MERLIERFLGWIGIWEPVIDVSEGGGVSGDTFVADIGEGEGSAETEASEGVADAIESDT